MQDDVFVGVGGDQEQRRDELARCRGVDHDVATPHRSAAGDGQREGAASVVVDSDAELPKAINERPQWPLAGPRIAVEPDGASGECREGDAESGHCSGEAAIDVGRPVQDGGRHGPVLACAVYDDA